MVSGAAGVYVGVLLQDAGIATDLVVRPGQRVSVSGDASLPRPPRWGDGGFAVQQRGSLSLSFVEVAGAVSASSGFSSLSLAQMAVTSAELQSISLGATAGSAVRLLEVTVTDSGPETGALTGSVNWGADGVMVYDPPGSLPLGLVRSAPAPSYRSLVRSSPRSGDGGSCCSRAARRFSPLRRLSRGPPARAARQVYADSYTLSGCATAERCGVFHRVAAHCAGGGYCKAAVQ